MTVIANVGMKLGGQTSSVRFGSQQRITCSEERISIRQWIDTLPLTREEETYILNYETVFFSGGMNGAVGQTNPFAKG